MTTRQHCANTVLMVRPCDFGFNYETALDNEFQQQPDFSEAAAIKSAANEEFDLAVKQLQTHGINVIVMKKDDDHVTPDAIFPNNWFSTTPDGQIYLFPMKALNRRLEIRELQLCTLLQEHQLKVTSVCRVGPPNESHRFLEGTGVIIFDHLTNTIFAALSERCDKQQLENFASLYGANNIVSFRTATSTGKPVYHTNVMMSIGEKFAVICDEVIHPDDRERVLDSLRANKTVVTITEQQMAGFCGNILELKNQAGQNIITMSQSAYNNFTISQKALLESCADLLSVNITTIEKIGGGSMRCMLAEIFNHHNDV